MIATDASIDKGEEEEGSDADELSEAEGAEGSDGEEPESDGGDVSDEEAALRPSKKVKKDTKKKAHSSSKSAEVDYGVSRGIDFQGVNFVVNFDFPASASAYTHRVGRTGRGGAAGTSLSFVSVTQHAASSTTASAAPASEVEAAARDAEVLETVREQQPRLNATGTAGNVLGSIGTGNELDEGSAQAEEERRMQPAPLQFNFKELETFRYRVEDTLRSVTTTAVRELRSAELKREILNSEKLKSFFAENPNDLKVLRHDKAIAHPIRQKDHLKSVPDYLMPISMRGVSNVKNKSKRGKKRKTTATTAVAASKKRNPLYNSAAGEAEGGEGEAGEANTGGDADGGDAGEGGGDPEPVFSNGSDALGSNASGRKQWQMRHKKGVFNPKAAKKNEHRTPGSFIKSKNYKK